MFYETYGYTVDIGQMAIFKISTSEVAVGITTSFSNPYDSLTPSLRVSKQFPAATIGKIES